MTTLKRDIAWYNVCQLIEDQWMIEDGGNPHIGFNGETENFTADGDKTLVTMELEDEDLAEVVGVLSATYSVDLSDITLETTLNKFVDMLVERANAQPA